MKRTPDFYTDAEKYGKVGEELFLSEHKRLDITDVRNVRKYQDIDVDFLIHWKDKQINVEVKTDTVAFMTNNLVYEVVAHNASGWGMITQADYMYEVLLGLYSDVVKTIVVDMHKWKEFIRDRKTPKKLNVLKETDTVNLLCDIDELRKYGAIIREKSYD